MNSVKTDLATPIAIALEFRERIQQALDLATKQAIGAEWQAVYNSFNPEQQLELKPHFADLFRSMERKVAKMDALIAEHLRKYPESAHLFKEA